MSTLLLALALAAPPQAPRPPQAPPVVEVAKPVDPWTGYRAALAAVRAGKRVVLHVGVKGDGYACPAFPGKPTGVYDCWLEEGEPVFRRRVEVPVSGPFLTPTTHVTAAGVTSTSSAVGVQMGRTFIGVNGVVTRGFTDPNCAGPV